ncbi:MAG: methyltransferase domain-containing protein, partial [Acidobacteriota bacterium]
YFAQSSGIDINQAKELYMLWKFRRALFSDYFNFKSKKITNSIIEKISPNFVSRKLYEAGIYTDFVPELGKIKMGDLNRISPIDTEFGYNRGGPVDRYYIENFLERFADRIKGRVLEVGDNEYTLRFGGSKVTQSDIMHIDENNPKATFYGDLSNIPHLPTDGFDCVILTQTLHLIYSYKEALETCRRVLKPGGTLLITVPGISQVDQGEWGKYWLWSFTVNSIKRLLSEIFPAEYSYVESFGNVLAATAFLYGIGLPEIKKEQMDYNDPQYQVIITAVAVKPE